MQAPRMAFMAHTIQNKKRLLTRIRRIQGQAQVRHCKGFWQLLLTRQNPQ